MMRIFFATDIHGSSVCWYKFVNAAKFYKANVVVLGGDMTGKAIVPVLEKDGKFQCHFLEREYVSSTLGELKSLVERIDLHGFYTYRVNQSEFDELKASEKNRNELFERLMIERLREWLQYAAANLKGSGVRCYVNPGNDDALAIDQVIEESECVINCEGKIIDLDDHRQMVGTGWTNPSPWNTPRECSDQELLKRIESLVSKVVDPRNCVLELHAPPYDSGLDEAPELDEKLRPKYAGHKRVPVGSKAVREVITKYQSLLGLHGHIHESRGIKRIGRTLCVNPGSMYTEGILLGYMINIDRDGIKSYVPTSG